MKAILIDSTARQVIEVQVHDGNVLREWYNLLKCDTVETAMYLNDNNDAIMVDGEGMFNRNDNRFFSYKEGHQPFAGDGLIVGIGSEGETISPTITVEEARANVEFLNPVDVRRRLAEWPE